MIQVAIEHINVAKPESSTLFSNNTKFQSDYREMFFDEGGGRRYSGVFNLIVHDAGQLMDNLTFTCGVRTEIV